ncbi:AAA family ATPase [uncultured Psychroserpens sp.]|uniref:KGGVGR-motif variant AAA ATPase n=1 Tax=uncultured Psychroserpens sp. TaxID=255436 RepID=UPI00260EC7F4|nr:AAA family ATPase [uncultured Psychroserpens sp.]
MKTITFYSYKGGVGRSLTLANIAMRLADLGKKVCLIDFDLEAPGLHLKFKDYLNSRSINKGLVEYISEFQRTGFLPNDFKNYLVDINYDGRLDGLIKFFPAGNVNNDNYWKDLSSINWKDLFYNDKSHGVELLLNLKEVINRDENPDFLLIDSRTGITDISGIAMTLLADTVVTLAANNNENINGISKIIKSLKNEKNNLRGVLPEVHFVLTRIPYYTNPEDKHKEAIIIRKTLNIINKEEELISKVFVIHSDRELEEEEKFKINTLSGKSKRNDIVPIEEDYLTLFEELTKNSLNGDEVSKFNNLRESELLIEQALSEKDKAIKINLLKKAIALNNKSDEAYCELASIYDDLEDYKAALSNINKALKIDKTNLHSKYVKSFILDSMGDREEEVLLLLDEIIERESNHWQAIFLKGNIFYRKENFKKALKYKLQLVDIDPNYHVGYNEVANVYRVLGEYDKAFEYIYKNLEMNPKSRYGTGTLAEIYSEIGNDREFYKNLQLSFVFGMKQKVFQRIISTEKVYRKYFKDKKFLELLNNYRIKVDFPE